MLCSVRHVLRLSRRQTVLNNKYFNHIRASTGLTNTQIEEKPKGKKDFTTLLQKYKGKITFNSYLEHDKLELGYYKYHIKTVKIAKKNLEKENEEKLLPPLPIALQYYLDKDRLIKEEENANTIQESNNEFQLPFGSSTKVEYDKNEVEINDTYNKSKIQSNSEEFDRSNIDRWMTNYEHFDDSTITSESYNESEELDDFSWSRYYGTPDPKVNVSRVPCGGCGALLHCTEPAIPGYLPSEIFKDSSIEDLKSMECQRCHFLKEYNIALDVNVEPEEYEALLQSIRRTKALVLLMVDLLDFPCSIWPGIVDIIGTDRPIIIVGNKVDLLPGDSIGYLNRIKQSLITEINKTKLGTANIKYVSLISAKTGYGVEDLISVMFKTWLYKGHVFLVGCTNVGKSSLFNALLQSDYCKVHAVDIIKRATVSRWPGTTLNLLKFPINRPSGWKIYQRTRRLMAESKLMKVEKEIRNAHLEGQTPTLAPALIGHIGRSFVDITAIEDPNKRMTMFDENHKLFAKSKWLYDTPGVIHPDQVLSLLSTEELLLTIPKQLIRPQTYYLYKGQTLFIAGLARVDFVNCAEPCRFTVFCSESLPITVTQTEDADDVYKNFVGTELFAVPSGGEERLKSWPGLKKCPNVMKFYGEGPKTCCGDIVLSSIAWVSVTAKAETICSVYAWTPEGRGIYKRHPSVLPYSINLKGKRIRDTPAYMVGKLFSDKE